MMGANCNPCMQAAHRRAATEGHLPQLRHHVKCSNSLCLRPPTPWGNPLPSRTPPPICMCRQWHRLRTFQSTVSSCLEASHRGLYTPAMDADWAAGKHVLRYVRTTARRSWLLGWGWK
jgi:hypothetical protein